MPFSAYTPLDQEIRDGIVFVGRALGPFFRLDPLLQAAQVGPMYAAVGELDVRAAAAEWPFVEDQEAAAALLLMQEGIGGGSDGSALAREFRLLFVGPARKAAPPWGSVYTDKDAVMFGASWAALRSWLRAAGVSARPAGAGEPEDHIGVMLELMAWLARNRPELLGDFLRLHLLPWAGHFLELLGEAARHPFFEGLAMLAKASLEGIQAACGIEVSHPRFYR